jgi:poly(hydroxyalkanoate) depolymerase family esterase
MKGLKSTLANLASLRGRFERLLARAAKGKGPGAEFSVRHLREVARFGSNPGNLRMLTHMRRNLPNTPALVVALHGCTQTAADYDLGSGWSELANRHGFAMLFPEQKRANNPNNCFNWFLPGDTRRDAGEVLSIRQMIDQMVEEQGIDRSRIFIVGLSAGGAMAAAMLAAYPEVFAGGAVIAGLPYGGAVNVQEALQTMAQPRQRSGEQWGDLVRSASSHTGPWPKISLWHGSADAIVNPQNMEEALKQWINVRGVSARPQTQEKVHGHLRRAWRTDAGDDVIEAVTIQGMNHGVPLATGHESIGQVGAFHFDVGISSSQHIAHFWDIADELPVHEMRPQVEVLPPLDRPASAPAIASASTARANAGAEDQAWQDPRTHITAALKAAGLLRDFPGGNPHDPRRIITSTLRSVGLLKE